MNNIDIKEYVNSFEFIDFDGFLFDFAGSITVSIGEEVVVAMPELPNNPSDLAKMVNASEIYIDFQKDYYIRLGIKIHYNISDKSSVQLSRRTSMVCCYVKQHEIQDLYSTIVAAYEYTGFPGADIEHALFKDKYVLKVAIAILDILGPIIKENQDHIDWCKQVWSL